MGCTSCAQRAAAARAARPQQKKSISPVTIENPTVVNYTLAQIKTWEDRLNCLKNTNQYEKIELPLHTLNIYLGLLKTIINNPKAISNFNKSLDSVSAQFIKLNVMKIC